MTDKRNPEAWVEIPGEAEVRASTPSGAVNPYDFGFIPAMSRLLVAHSRIGPVFRALFREIMFQAGDLSRREREMVAAVAAAAQDCHY